MKTLERERVFDLEKKFPDVSQLFWELGLLQLLWLLASELPDFFQLLPDGQVAAGAFPPEPELRGGEL